MASRTEVLHAIVRRYLEAARAERSRILDWFAALTGHHRIRTAMELLRFPLRGIDFDIDGSFMNDQVVPWCRDNGLLVTRTRACKNHEHGPI